MVGTSEIRNGLCVRHNHDIFKIIEFLHVKPGKGPAFVRMKLRSLTTGKVLDNTVPSNHKLDDIRVENRKYQFLYKTGTDYFFMNTEDFEQITLEEKAINAPQYLKEGIVVDIMFLPEENRSLTCELPMFVDLVVESVEPGVKGNTATNSTKPAIVETGATVNVPLFINEGEKIKIDTTQGVYSERSKN